MIAHGKLSDPKRRRWWIVFRDRINDRERGWWDWFTHPGFRHCFAFTELSAGQVLLIDPLAAGVDMALLTVRPDALIQACHERGFRVLVAKIPKRAHNPRPIRRGIGITCASYLAYTLAFDGSPITPRGLYRMALRAGARELRRV